MPGGIALCWLCVGQAESSLVRFMDLKYGKGFGIVLCIDFLLYVATQYELSSKGPIEINSIQYLWINIEIFLLHDNCCAPCTVFLHVCQKHKDTISCFSVNRVQCLVLSPPYYSNCCVIFQAIGRYLLYH